jgi:hypothetical protein
MDESRHGGMRPLWRTLDNIEMDLKEVACENMDSIHLAQENA